jgi:DNA-binding transcriptional LysR family regulator
MLRFTMMSALTSLPRAVARFQARYPDVELHIAPGGSTEQLEAITRGGCDIGFVSLKKAIAPLATEVIESSTLVGLFAETHVLARRKFIGFESFSDARCIFLSELSEPGIRMMSRRRFAELKLPEPRVVLEVDQVETLLAFVAVGFGVSFCPALVERLPFPGVRIVPIRPEVPCGISAVWNPAALSPTATRFLEVLHEERDHPC